MRAGAIRPSGADRINLAVINGCVALALLMVAYPLYFVLIASVSDPVAIYAGRVWLWPRGLTFAGYERIFNTGAIWRGYANTIFYAVFGTLLNIAMTVTVAYPLSTRRFSGRYLLMIFLLVTLYFEGGLIPKYLLVRSLGLLDTRAVMVIMGAAMVWHVIVTRTFFQTTIADELYEAAAIDGCNHIPFFVRIVLPLSSPVIAVLAIYYGVEHWNDYFKALIFLESPEKHPLQIVLRSILILDDPQTVADIADLQERQRAAELIKYGSIVVASLPLLIVYPFLQKYFVQGIMIGSLKG